MLKNIIMILRTWIKFILLICLGLIIVLSIFVAFYKSIYSVTVDGEIIGYSKDKSILQAKINEYMENGDGTNSNLAFIQIDNMPEYKLCLLKRGITTDDEAIYNKVISTGISYYKYYSVLDNNEEKLYVENFETAEKVVEKLKEKKSNNINDISILEKYGTELKEFTSIEDAVSKLYEAKPVVVATHPPIKKTSISKSMSYQKVKLNVSLIRPISGIITSRFGSISKVRTGAHKGLDIAAPKGTKIVAAAAGKVTYSGYQGSLGYLIKLAHGDGVETYYAHCSALYVKEGQEVNQGDTIAAVGSTGNSTGPHLHLEVRVNGVAYNPQNYVY